MFGKVTFITSMCGLAISVGCVSQPREFHASSSRQMKRDWFSAAEESIGVPTESFDAAQVSHQEPLPVPDSDELAASEILAGSGSIEQLVQHALVNNPKVVAARYKAESLLAKIPQARALEDPQLTTTVFLDAIQTAAGPQDVIMSLTQRIPWLGKRDARGNIVFHDAQAAFASMADAELQVVEQVKLAYYELYFVEAATKVYRDLDAQLADVVDSARVKYETNAQKFGLESVYQTEVARSKLQISMAELERLRATAEANLRQALHLSSHASLNIQPVLSRTSLASTPALLVATIEQCHPELELARHEILRQEAAIDLAHRNYFPDLNLGFNWHAISSNGISPVATGDDAYSLMVGLNLPIYKQKRDAAVNEAHSLMVASTREYLATLDRLRNQVESAYADASEHGRVLQILDEELLAKSKQTFELALEAYRVDRVGYDQLIDAYEDMLRLQLAYYLRTARREQAIARLERAVGCALVDGQILGIHRAP